MPFLSDHEHHSFSSYYFLLLPLTSPVTLVKAFFTSAPRERQLFAPGPRFFSISQSGYGNTASSGAT